MPLLPSAVTQNSARIWKSLYELWETRNAGSPLSLLSATMAPSRARQLPPPMLIQLFRPPGPSISVSQPVVAGGAFAQPTMARVASSEVAAKEGNRVTSRPFDRCSCRAGPLFIAPSSASRCCLLFLPDHVTHEAVGLRELVVEFARAFVVLARHPVQAGPALGAHGVAQPLDQRLPDPVPARRGQNEQVFQQANRLGLPRVLMHHAVGESVHLAIDLG